MNYGRHEGITDTCPPWQWIWRRLEVRQCPTCGTWWRAEPASVWGSGGWCRVTRLGVWWARKRNRIHEGDAP